LISFSFNNKKIVMTNLIKRPDMPKMSIYFVRVSIVVLLVTLFYLLSLIMDCVDLFHAMFGKISFSLGARALASCLIFIGLPGGLAFAIYFAFKVFFGGGDITLFMDDAGGQPAANPAAEQPSNGSSGASTSGSGSGEGAGGRGFRWTDLFGSVSTGNSETGENSVASLNQPAHHSPEPEGDRGGPLIPEDPNENHLIPAQQRMEELGHRLSLNSLAKNLTDKEWGSIVAAQITVEERVEVTLLSDGFSPDAVLNKRHQIRGLMFYPDGTSLTEKTYLNYVRSIDTSGTHASVPYKRVMQAIERHDLDLSGPD